MHNSHRAGGVALIAKLNQQIRDVAGDVDVEGYVLIAAVRSPGGKATHIVISPPSQDPVTSTDLIITTSNRIRAGGRGVRRMTDYVD